MKKILLFVFVFTASLGAILYTTPAFATKAPACGVYKDGAQKGKEIPICCGVDSSGNAIETTIDFGDLCSKQGASPIAAMLLWAIGFLSVGVGIAVVIGIIFGGITYAMSDGDEGKAKEGREIIANSIIGLFLFIFLWAGANFLIPGGLFK